MHTSFIESPTAGAVQKNILATYFTMRGGMVLFSALFPFVLLFYSLWAHNWTLSESSISAYYGADDAAMRNYFVATLCVLGTLLAVYKGFSLLENILLKTAGVSVALVAFFPCQCWEGGRAKDFFHYAHDTVAVLFFASMILVIELCAIDTITMLDTNKLRKQFTYAYHAIAGSLLVAAVASVVVNYISGLGRKSIFVPEMFAVLIFAVYWFVKSREFHHTAAEKKAAKGEIIKVQGKLYDATKPAQMAAAAESSIENAKQP